MTTTTGHNEEPTTASTAPEKAAEVASAVKEQASAVTGVSKDEAVAVAQHAATHVRDVVDRSRDEVRRRADEQARQLASTLNGLGRELTDVARGNAPVEGVVADVATQLGSTVTNFAQKLEDGGLDGALRDLKDFSRRRPGMFLLASMGAGVVCGRVWRSADTQSLIQATKPTADGANSAPPTTIAPGTGESIDLTGLGM
jgi:uncharacterized protein YjbJ (UPF0337 family)